MTLIDDNLENVRTAILVAIKNELVDTYPKEFGDYKTGRDDIYTKVYWSDTTRYQPKFPYCVLTPLRDVSEGFDEISYFKNSEGILKKRVTTRSFLTITIDVFNMGNEQVDRSSLESDTFAYKVARQLRKYFNGDGKLDWFSGNEYYPRQIGITVESDINAIIDWADTDAVFRYSFDITAGWDDIVVSDADLAKSANISVYENTKEIDNFTVEIGKTIRRYK